MSSRRIVWGLDVELDVVYRIRKQAVRIYVSGAVPEAAAIRMFSCRANPYVEHGRSVFRYYTAYTGHEEDMRGGKPRCLWVPQLGILVERLALRE